MLRALRFERRRTSRRSWSTAASAASLFLSTPFDAGSAALLADLGVPAFKVGSGELTNLPFLDDLARRTGCRCCSRPGCATLEEVAAAVEVIRPAAPRSRCCTASRAIRRPTEEANLRAIDTLRDGVRASRSVTRTTAWGRR